MLNFGLLQLIIRKLIQLSNTLLSFSFFGRGDDDYLPGNIVRIELCNFMTFSKLTCKPGSRLNLVIGPNGSGKSSLVCAIALGLGGEPQVKDNCFHLSSPPFFVCTCEAVFEDYISFGLQVLGRAKKIGAYVKRGEESGYIEISLRGESKQEKLVITRKIDIQNKSEWLFNGKVSLSLCD